MRYAFLGLMCVFAGMYAAIRDRGSFGARLTVKAIASVSFVLIAFAGRLDAAQPYYALIITGLCFSLAGDVLLVFSGAGMVFAGGTAFFLAHIGYIAAFFIYAAPAWYDAALFTAFIVIGTSFFAGKKLEAGYSIPLFFLLISAISPLFLYMPHRHGMTQRCLPLLLS